MCVCVFVCCCVLLNLFILEVSKWVFFSPKHKLIEKKSQSFLIVIIERLASSQSIGSFQTSLDMFYSGTLIQS